MDGVAHTPAFSSILGRVALKIELASQTYYRAGMTIESSSDEYSDLVLYRAVFALMLNPDASRDFPPLCFLSDRLFNYARYMAKFLTEISESFTGILSPDEGDDILQNACEVADIYDHVAIKDGKYSGDDDESPDEATVSDPFTLETINKIMLELENEPADVRDQVRYNHNGMLLAYVADWIRRNELPPPPPSPVAYSADYPRRSARIAGLNHRHM